MLGLVKLVAMIVGGYALIGWLAGAPLWAALLPPLVTVPFICLIYFLSRDEPPHFPTWPP